MTPERDTSCSGEVFLSQASTMNVGIEWLIDAEGCQASLLRDLNAIQSVCDQIIADLGLRDIRVPVPLVHGTADSDVHPDQSEHALELLPNVEIDRIPLGTHLAVWTDPISDAVQARIIDRLKG